MVVGGVAAWVIGGILLHAILIWALLYGFTQTLD
jgi:hypothetical protein